MFIAEDSDSAQGIIGCTIFSSLLLILAIYHLENLEIFQRSVAENRPHPAAAGICHHRHIHGYGRRYVDNTGILALYNMENYRLLHFGRIGA